MWPWEHLAFGYLWYSLPRRLTGSGPPAETAVVALAVGTQFPDLIDKPLAWGLAVLPSGLSLAHSLLVAVPVWVVAVAVASRVGRPSVGVAAAVGYASHLAGDVLYPLVVDGTLRIRFLLWPLTRAPVVDAPGLVFQVRLFLSEFGVFLASPRGRLYLLAEFVVMAATLAVWLVDGSPGIGLARRSVARRDESR
jgi:hypothetical protein